MSTVPVAPPVADGLFSLDPPALLAGRCGECGALHFPRRELCPECQAAAIAAAPLSQLGTIFTFTIVRMAPPGYVGESPYAVGVVELPDGLRVSATITSNDLDSLEIGDEVEFELVTLGSGDEQITSYAFRKRAGP